MADSASQPLIAVLGPGGVGGFLAAALARTGGPVTLIARESSAAVIAEHGLRVRSRLLGDFVARPRVVTELTEPVGGLLIATKAVGLTEALARIAAPPGLVVPLLNGLEHLEPLRERFGADTVAAAVIRVDSDRPSTGEIVQGSPGGRIDIAGDDERIAALAAALRRAGVEVRTGDREPNVMWSKLARLCPLALTTSATMAPIGQIRSDARWRSALEGAINETVAVGQAEGATLDAAATLAELDAAHPDLGSSMQRDIAAGRAPELDAIAGAVLRAGERHALRCPTVGWLTDRVADRAGIPWLT
jgi:2-dehydropantoate 2-reductase